MEYTKINQKVLDDLNDIISMPYDENNCRNHPTHFAIHYLGITPYKYQHMILKKFRDGTEREQDNYRTIICKSRQIGLSMTLGILALWAAHYNKFSSGIHQDTKVCIVSQDDSSAKKLMKEIQQMTFNSKRNMIQFVKRVHGKPLNKREISFMKGWIKTFPPTDAIRGSTADLLICDEAAYIDADIFKDAMEPTVSFVNGRIILSSTPKGVANLFYELFDPFDVVKTHEYKRYWFHWKMCENEVQKKLIKQKQDHARKSGNLKSFSQEYEAQFTADVSSFLDNADIEKCVNKDIQEVYEFHDFPCSLGIDYGGSVSATALIIIANINGKLRLLFKYSKINFDLNLFTNPEWEHSIQNLMKRYNIVTIVADSCPQGIQTNTYLENNGYPILKFNFRSDQSEGERNRGYFVFRTWLKNSKIEYPEIKSLIMQMKSLEETALSVTTRIKSPRGYLCDEADSLMLACYPFMTESGAFTSTVVDYKEVMDKIHKDKKFQDGRHDAEWEKINIEQGETIIFDR